MAAKNPAIGTCPCPITGCDATCEVRKFKSEHKRDSGRRWAGKLYMDCPKHGRFGIDAKSDMQDWILDHAKLDGPLDEPPPRSEPAPSSPPPAKKGSFGFFS